jgi:hypothetical protein
MAIIGKAQSKTTPELEGIPPMLQRKPNGNVQPSYEELAAMVTALQAQVARKGTLTLKVSEKGALSIYGMGRFPVSLYREQWERLLAAKDEILAFIEANAEKLSVKA